MPEQMRMKSMIEMGNGAAGNSVCSEQEEGKRLWKRVTKRPTYRDGHKMDHIYRDTARVDANPDKWRPPPAVNQKSNSGPVRDVRADEDEHEIDD